MGGLADALEKACLDLRVHIQREAEVRRILVENGQVRGVALADGSLLEAQVVALLDKLNSLPVEPVLARIDILLQRVDTGGPAYGVTSYASAAW